MYLIRSKLFFHSNKTETLYIFGSSEYDVVNKLIDVKMVRFACCVCRGAVDAVRQVLRRVVHRVPRRGPLRRPRRLLHAPRRLCPGHRQYVSHTKSFIHLSFWTSTHRDKFKSKIRLERGSLSPPFSLSFLLFLPPSFLLSTVIQYNRAGKLDRVPLHLCWIRTYRHTV